MYGGGGSSFNSRGVHDDDGTKPGPSPHSQGVLAALQVVRYPTLPSLEQFKSVDVQVGGRLFQQVPLKVRTELWTNLTNQTLTGRDSAMRYPGLQAQVVSSKACGEIQKDIPRTFPDVPGFDDSAGQRRLMRILRSYCALDPEVGYCQGMNFVAGLLLRYLPCEANAFAAFCVLMRDRNYRELFHPSMAHLKGRMAQLEAKLPAAVASRLRRCQIPPELYAPQWLLSCFGNEFPTTFGARVIDDLLAGRGGRLAADTLLAVAVEIFVAIDFGGVAEDFESTLRAVREAPRAWGERQLSEVLTRALGG